MGDKRIGKYSLLRKMGAGQFGVVSIAKDTETNEWCAIKMIPKKRPNGNPDHSFENEVKALRRLEGTEGVPDLYDTGEKPLHRYIVMEYLSADLKHLQMKNEDHMLRPETVLKICFHAVQILERIHRVGFVHQDLKPDNWMLSVFDDNTADLVLVDYGHAQMFRDENGKRLENTSNTLIFDNLWAPPGAQGGRLYLESEELVSLGYTICALRNAKPWKPEPGEDALQMKLEFAKSPNEFLFTKDEFLVPVLQALNNQTYGEDPDYNGIREVIMESLRGYNASTEITTEEVDGTLRLF